MRARQPVPTLWLMTDERADATLDRALARLPRGAGIVFRHHATEPGARRLRFAHVRRIARRRGLTLVLAGSTADAVAWRSDGWHGRSPHRLPLRLRIRTAPAHDRRELTAAKRAGADIAFVSPVFATRSHPGSAVLGPIRFGLIARAARLPVAALGGMDAKRYPRLKALGASGWAAIDAWSVQANQKRKVVPR